MSKSLSQIGEFGLINILKKYHGADTTVIKGIGDDTAVLPWDAKRYLLLTTDMLVEGVHFTRRMPPRSIGRKALACSISDIAAMGGLPRYAVVSLGIPSHFSVAAARGIYEGIHRLAKEFRVAVVGGDTVRSAKVVINVALAGEVEKKNIVDRGGARNGDLIFVTGALGRSLSSGRHARFIPRVKAARYLVQRFKPTAMIDISDGLAADLGHILEESKCGARLWEKRIPKGKGAGLNNALCDGEDFELLFTLRPAKAKALAKRRTPFRFYGIGEITARGRGLRLRDKRGRERKLPVRGYTHF